MKMELEIPLVYTYGSFIYLFVNVIYCMLHLFMFYI